MADDNNTPIQYKTKEFRNVPLYSIVYHVSEKGRPISYQRLYARGYQQMQIILRVISKYYHSHKGEGVGGRGKIHQKRLSELTGIKTTTLRDLLIKMASMKILLKREKGQYTTVHRGPLIILQQASKYITRKKWGRKTCVYIMPYEEEYFEE